MRTVGQRERAATRHAALDQLVEDVAAGRVLDGVDRCVLRVETPQESDTWATAVGPPASRGSADADGAFRAASVTKVVTAATVLAMADEGLWNLHDPVATWLPPQLVERIHVLDGISHGGSITLRQCLDHTSGLPDHFAHPAVWASIRSGRSSRRFTPADLVELAIDNGPPSFAPGSGRHYTDTGFVLAGLAAQNRTGQPLHALFRRYVLAPAGAVDTWLESGDDRPATARSARIAPHLLNGVDISSLDPTVDWAAGGLVTTAEDLVAVLRAILMGDALSAAAKSQMGRWAPGPGAYYDSYGLGLGRYEIAGVELIGHHGVWGAFVFWLPQADTYLAGTINTGAIDRRPLFARLAELLVS